MKFYTWSWWEEDDKSSKPKNKGLEKNLQLLDLERKCLEVDMTNVLSSFESNIGHEPK